MTAQQPSAPGPSAVQQVLVDGVPVLWTSAPAPLTAGLVFGVGRRDETFLLGGVTHLVEHLVMSTIGRTTLDCNATVDLTTTEFTATGRPDRVVAFLRQVCQALQALPVERVAVEAQVLRAEDGAVVHPAVGALLARRYGGRGAGLAGYSEPALTALSAADVQSWSDTRFVRGAAALWLSGPPPEGLSLPLADGAALPAAVSEPRPLSLPGLVELPFDGAVAVGAEVAPSPGLPATCRILADRLEDDLRHRRGVSYTVLAERVVLAADRRFVAVKADCRDGSEALAARALWSGLSRLADEGPTPDELAHYRDAVEEYLDDPRAPVLEAQAAAVALASGVPDRSAAELLEETRALTPEHVRTAAQVIRSGALVGVPAGVQVALADVSALPASSAAPVPGRVFRPRRRADVPRSARLVVGEDGVSVDDADDEVLTVRYADVVGLLEAAPGYWSLVGADGISVPLSPGDWRDGSSALDLVRAAVPRELHVPYDDLRTERRVVLLRVPPYLAGQALWPSRSGAWVLQEESWTVVVRDQDQVEAYASAAGMSAALGRRHPVLLLEQASDELSLVVMHRGVERDRHVWTGEAHDPSLLAGLLDTEPDELAAILAADAPPSEVLAALTRTIGIPEQVAQVLAGTPVAQVSGFVHEPPRGVRASMAAGMRGDYDPPDSTAFLHRLTRWERDRPPAYRAANAALSGAQAVAAGVVATRASGHWSRRSAAWFAFWVLGALGNLYSAGPSRSGRRTSGQ